MAMAGQRGREARPQPKGSAGGRGGMPDDGRSKTLQYRDFSDGLVIAGSRAGIPDTALYECINAQVIGPGQIRTLTDPGASVFSFPSNATSIWGVVLNVSGTES